MTYTPPTRAEEARIYTISYYCGCLPCTIRGNLNSHCDVHHLTTGGRRIGHMHTYGCCPYHHRGVIQFDQELKVKGPSMALDRAEYIQMFGPEYILLEAQDFFLSQWQSLRWFEHSVPEGVGLAVREYWYGLTLKDKAAN